MCSTKPTVHSRVFEDNSEESEIAKVAKMRPRTKHIKQHKVPPLQGLC